MRRALFLLGCAAAVVAAFVACEDDPRYVYTAKQYDPVNGCLTDYKSIETVPGHGVSVRCPLSCLTVNDVVYVSPVCPPLPANAEALEDGDPRCQAALDASAQEASCSGGGGGGSGSGQDELDADTNEGG